MLIKKINIIIVLVFFFTQIFCETNDKDSKLIKHKIIIIPVYYDKQSDKYGYLGEIIKDEIKNKISNLFEIIEPDKNGIDKDNLKTAVNNNADIILTGNLSLINNKIKLNLKSFDAINSKIIADNFIEININFDMYRFINQFVMEHTNNLINYAAYYNLNYLAGLISNNKTDKKKLVDNLVNQKDAYWYYLINNFDEYKEPIKIPFGKNVLIFINQEKTDFKVDVDGIKNDNTSNIKIFSFENDLNKTRKITINYNGKNIITNYVQKNLYEVTEIYVNKNNLFSDIEKSICYVDVLADFTTSGYTGVDLRVGMGLPFKSFLENNLYFKLFIGAKALNFVETQTGIYFENPHLKFKFGTGYQHAFYIKKFASINLAFETGFEFSLLSFLIKDKIKYNTNGLIFGFPSFYVSFPFEVQLFANKKASLIIGVEPTIRLVLNYFVYDSILWLEYLDETRGYGFKYFRYNIGNYTTFDLLFYDMPIYIGVRIKI